VSGSSYHRVHVDVRLLCCREKALAGIVYQNIQPAEMLVRLLNDLVHRLRIGHVEGQWQNRVSEALFKVRDVFQLSRRGRDLVSALERGFGPDAAETARGASAFNPAYNPYFRDL
jgi:hypothetical protein